MDVPIKNGDFPVRYVAVYQRVAIPTSDRMIRRTHPKHLGGHASIAVESDPVKSSLHHISNYH